MPSLTLSEAVQELDGKVSRSTLERAINAGDLTAKRVRRRAGKPAYIVERDDLLRWNSTRNKRSRAEEHAMPTSKQRRRIEIHADIYQQLSDLATREGYPVNRFADKLLALALEEHAQAHQNDRYPFGHTLLNMAKALLRQGNTGAQ
jgi:hypothetical protein